MSEETQAWVPSLGLDYAVYEKMHMSGYGWGSWELKAVFLNERDAELFVSENKSSISQRKTFVTKSCWQNWHTQSVHHAHEGVRKMFKEWITKYADAHVTGHLSRYQLPDL